MRAGGGGRSGAQVGGEGAVGGDDVAVEADDAAGGELGLLLVAALVLGVEGEEAEDEEVEVGRDHRQPKQDEDQAKGHISAGSFESVISQRPKNEVSLLRSSLKSTIFL